MKTFFVLISILLTGCATKFSVDRLGDYELEYAIKVKDYKSALREMEYREKEVANKDYVILLLNKAVILHYDSQYVKSNEILEKVKKRVQFQTLTFSEKIVKYLASDKHNKFKLEAHEELMIFNLISLNYSLLGRMNEALVEARAWDYVLQKNDNNEHFSKSNNFYLSYLSGIFYESQGKNYDAYIDYSRTAPYNDKFPYIGYDLYRTAKKIDKERRTIADKYDIEKQYQLYVEDKEYVKEGELVIFFLNGIGPFKVESEHNSNVPTYQERLSMCNYASIEIDTQDYGQTISIFDINKTAKDLLAAKYRELAIDGLKRMGAKEMVAIPLDIASMGSLSLISRALLYSMGGPDYRSWTYMPKEIQIARIPLTKGIHKIKIKMNDEIVERTVRIIPGQTKVISVNYQKTI